MNAAVPAIRMSGIRKRFGRVLANDDVTVAVAPGTIHGLVGENGAGKSTLMSILYGLYTPDAGTIEVAGRPAVIGNALEAIGLGLGMVHQHFMLVDTLTVLENIMLGAEPHALLRRAEGEARGKLEALMAAHYVKPTVAVMGVSMPILDGIETARLLKASPSTRHARVVAYTAWPSFYDGPLKSVFDGVLAKPSTSEALVAAVRRFAGGEPALSAAAG